MSLHRAGNVAPLPSPTSLTTPSDHYFAPLGSLTGQSQQSPQQQQQALLQTQHAQRTREAEFAQQKHASKHEPLQLDPSKQLPKAQEQTGIWSASQGDLQRQGYESATGPPAQHQSRQLSGSSTHSEASLHLRDFSLLAEAAKRAQVAVVTRDLEDVSL